MTRTIYQEIVRNKAARDGVLLTIRMMGLIWDCKQHQDIALGYHPAKPDHHLDRALKHALAALQELRKLSKRSAQPTTADRLQERIKEAWGKHYPKIISGVMTAVPNTAAAGAGARLADGTLHLTSRWYREVHKRGLQTVGGVVVLDAWHLSTGGRVALYRATWIRKLRGQDFTQEEGVIAQDTINGCAMYGSTVKGAKKALTNEIRRQVVARLTAGVTDAVAAVI